MNFKIVLQNWYDFKTFVVNEFNNTFKHGVLQTLLKILKEGTCFLKYALCGRSCVKKWPPGNFKYILFQLRVTIFNILA